MPQENLTQENFVDPDAPVPYPTTLLMTFQRQDAIKKIVDSFHNRLGPSSYHLEQTSRDSEGNPGPGGPNECTLRFSRHPKFYVDVHLTFLGSHPTGGRTADYAHSDNPNVQVFIKHFPQYDSPAIKVSGFEWGDDDDFYGPFGHVDGLTQFWIEAWTHVWDEALDKNSDIVYERHDYLK